MGLGTSFVDLSRSMLHLLDGQQVTNPLPCPIQLNNTTQQAHVDALKELKASKFPKKF